MCATNSWPKPAEGRGRRRVVYNHPQTSPFLMYPCAVTARDELNQLRPETFRYTIRA